MNDVIKEAFNKLRKRETKTNKFFLLKRYLRVKYGISISRACLLFRLKQWSKEQPL
jgi:hypothetical protein